MSLSSGTSNDLTSPFASESDCQVTQAGLVSCPPRWVYENRVSCNLIQSLEQPAATSIRRPLSICIPAALWLALCAYAESTRTSSHHSSCVSGLFSPFRAFHTYIEARWAVNLRIFYFDRYNDSFYIKNASGGFVAGWTTGCDSLGSYGTATGYRRERRWCSLLLPVESVAASCCCGSLLQNSQPLCCRGQHFQCTVHKAFHLSNSEFVCWVHAHGLVEVCAHCLVGFAPFVCILAGLRV